MSIFFVFMVLITIILIVSSVLNRTRIPLETAFMIAGILVGPHGFRILPLGESVQALASIGLIYMLFLAGLDIPTERIRKIGLRAVTFGIFTFTIPFIVGFSIGRYFHLDLLGSILLGSILSSHAIITYPLLKDRGLMNEEVVSIAFLGTVLTDTAALLILALIVAAKAGRAVGSEFIQLGILFAIFVLVILGGVPRLAKKFFELDRAKRSDFHFIILILLITAVLAEIIKIHAAVGAFLAGIALSAGLKYHADAQPLREVYFFGRGFFIPIFLIVVGMNANLTILISKAQSLVITSSIVLGNNTKFVYTKVWEHKANFVYIKLDEMLTLRYKI
ncbi:MAG: cation:proton antiporter [Actinomycetota bacterium]|nr:cation:proton antiporter [Actinomycetota bacterium]